MRAIFYCASMLEAEGGVLGAKVQFFFEIYKYSANKVRNICITQIFFVILQAKLF